MLVFAVTNLPTDIPYWVNRSVFYSHFSQADFNCREIQEVQQKYRSDWFHRLDNGNLGFYIPVVNAIDRRTDLINRHRLAVLLPHMDELPIAFTSFIISPVAKEFLSSIPKRPLDVLEPFWIPDFKIVDALP